MVADSTEYVSQPGARIDIVQPCGDDERVHGRSALTSSIRRDLMMPGVWGVRSRSHIRSIRCSGGLRSWSPISSTTATGI